MKATNGTPPHPLLISIEDDKMEILRNTPSAAHTASVDDVLARNDFLAAMSSFRPKETIFEAKASAGGSANMGAVDRTRNIGTVKGDSKAIMKSMRREMKVNRNKSYLVIAGSETAQTLNGDEVVAEVDEEEGGDDQAEQEEEEEDEEAEAPASFASAFPVPAAASNPAQPSKRKLTSKERKLLKAGKPLPPPTTKRPPTWAKSEDFIEYDKVSSRDRDVEAALQPSSGTGRTAKSSALELINAQLDIVGDEKEDLVSRQRIMRWDKQKRKYIQTTIGDEAEGMTHAKKVRLESGQTLKGKAAKEMKLGALYEKWQAKTGKTAGRVGVFDDVQTEEDAAREAEAAANPEEPKRTPGGKKINPRWQTKEGQAAKAANKKNNSDEIKSASQMKKKRERDADMKIKNMKKGDRTSFLKHKKEKEGRGGGKPGAGDLKPGKPGKNDKPVQKQQWGKGRPGQSKR